MRYVNDDGDELSSNDRPNKGPKPYFQPEPLFWIPIIANL